MEFLLLIIISLIVYVVTVGLIVISQEVSTILALVIFIGFAYGAFKLITSRLTKI